jgi:prolipoprotein diacylglyceryltransferase
LWCPRYWHFWGWSLSAYSVFLYLGGSLWLGLFFLSALRSFREEDVLNLGTLIMASSVILGGSIFLASSGKFGLSFYGASLGALIGVALYCRRRGLSLLEVGDIGAAPTALAFAVMKVGCLVGGCCYGLPTRQFLHAIYTSRPGEKTPKALADLPSLDGTPLYPIQLWVALSALGIFLLLVSFRKQLGAARGRTFAIALGFYALSRWIIDFWSGERGPQLHAGMSGNQWLGLIMLGVAIAIFSRGMSWEKLQRA